MTPAQVEAVMLECIPIARAYFQIDPAWKVTIQHNPTINGAQIHIRNRYRTALLEHGQLIDTPAESWMIAAHEIAHVALAELMLLKTQIALHLEEDELPGTLEDIFTVCMESMIQRLADMFVSACPCPFESNVVRSAAQSKA